MENIIIFLAATVLVSIVFGMAAFVSEIVSKKTRP